MAVTSRPRSRPPAPSRRTRSPHPRAVPEGDAAARPGLPRRVDLRLGDRAHLLPRLDRGRPGRGAAGAGRFVLRDVFGENVILVRGRDDVIRAFYNVCRHRGTAVEERECGKAVRFQCPYHAWIYDLDGRLIRARHTEDLEDFSFDDLRPDADPLRDLAAASSSCASPTRRRRRRCATYMGDWFDHHAGFGRDMSTLRRAARLTYDVGANWKIVAENYSECYHCPPVHPLLNKLTPYDLGEDFLAEGPWKGGWMVVRRRLRDDVDRRHARRPAAALRPRRDRGAADLLLHPVAEPDRLGPPRLRADPPGVARRPEPQHRPLRPLRGGGPARRRSTSRAPSSSGTSPTARTTTSSRCSSRGRARAPGPRAATRTRRPRSTPST